MSKIDEERLYKLRHELEVELQQVVIFTDFEGTYIYITYDGKSVCKIRTNGSGYDVTYTNEFSDEGCSHKTWLPGYRSITRSIRNAIFKYEKGQKNMMTLGDLRDYIQQELGNLVAAVYEPTNSRPGSNNDRIKVNHGGCWVCSIYRCKRNYDLFTVIFYDPFVCISAGYSSVVDLTIAEVPRSIKNRINICEGDNCKINVNIQDSIVDKVLLQCKGGFTYANPVMKTGKINITVESFIKDVIFNDPATIVFWTDGTKTVVKCQKGETFDPEKGLAMAISKKVLGNDYGYYETFAKHVGRYNKKHKEK